MNSMKYRVYMVCFDYYLQDMFTTYQDAVDKGKYTGFEYRVDKYMENMV